MVGVVGIIIIIIKIIFSGYETVSVTMYTTHSRASDNNIHTLNPCESNHMDGPTGHKKVSAFILLSLSVRFITRHANTLTTCPRNDVTFSTYIQTRKHVSIEHAIACYK